MHIVLADALLPAEFSADVLRDLALPSLEKWLRHAALLSCENETPALQRTTPAIRALLNACGIAASEHQAPTAALLMLADGLQPGNQVWHLLTPAHYALARDYVRLAELSPEINTATKNKLWQQAQEVLEATGAQLLPGQAQRWYLHHPDLNNLCGSDPSRALGRNVDIWMPTSTDNAARLWRRWHTEIQMLWHEQAMNGLWLSGSGALPAAPALKKSLAPQSHALMQGLAQWMSAPLLELNTQVDLVFLDDLSMPAMQQNWHDWRAALQSLEQHCFAPLMQNGARFTLTISGEFVSRTWRIDPRQRWKVWQRRTLTQCLGL